MSSFRCSVASAERGEATLGTASRIDRWLLVEASGPWGPRALPQARTVPDPALLTLQQRAKQQHARTLLLRRPGPAVEASSRRVLVADSRPGRERLLGRVVADDELADLPLPFEGEAPGWSTVAALVAVCTHGTHDVCCAVWGRPVAAALAASHPELTWEVSHLGGDRFAPNVLVLPAGHYLGRLSPEAAPAAVDALLAGDRPDPYYRGRSCWQMPVQAALTLAGTELDVGRLDGLTPRRLDAAGDHRWRVTLEVTGDPRGRVVAEVEQELGPGRSPLTCGTDVARPTPRWRLRSLTPAD